MEEVEVIFAVYFVAKWRRIWWWCGFIGGSWVLVVHSKMLFHSVTNYSDLVVKE